jgi:uncharacterized RDD family membrane protein YckC
MTPADVPPRAEDDRRPTEADARDAFWARVLAAIADMLVLSLIYSFVNFVYGVTQVTSGSPIPAAGSGFTQFSTNTSVGWGWLTLLWLVYFISLEALFGATIGKWLFRLRVTDGAGQGASLWQNVVRNIARIVDALPGIYLIGGVVALLSSRRQRIGDHLAHTLVISRAALAAPLLTPSQLRRRLALVSGALLLGIAFSAVFFYYGRPPLVVQSMANTGVMMFDGGVTSYTLGAPTWGSGTVTYQMTYRTTPSTQPCHARLTLVWSFPTGWEPGNAVTSCETNAP